MKHKLKNNIFLLLFGLVLVSCQNYRKLVTDEIVLKDENSQTGTIIKCDSVNLKIKKMDESISVIPWSTVDTVQGKKLKTLFLGLNVGYYNSPYFSVFKNEPLVARSLGMQYKLGVALRSRRMYYLSLILIPAQPYAINKYGIGYQRYFKKSNYLKDNCFFVGTEVNLMNAKYNNGVQVTFDPFIGFEKKLNEHLRIHYKMGLQFNFANKNNSTGINFTIGLHFMKRNFKEYYNILNTEHRLPRQ